MAGGAAHVTGPAAREPRALPAWDVRQQHGLGRRPARAPRAQRPAPPAMSGNRPGSAGEPRRRSRPDDAGRHGRSPAAARVRPPRQAHPRPLDRRRGRLRAARHRRTVAGAHRMAPRRAGRPRAGPANRPSRAPSGPPHRPRADLPPGGVRRRPEDHSRPHRLVRCAFGGPLARLARSDGAPPRPPADRAPRNRRPRCCAGGAAGGQLPGDRRVHRGPAAGGRAVGRGSGPDRRGGR